MNQRRSGGRPRSGTNAESDRDGTCRLPPVVPSSSCWMPMGNNYIFTLTPTFTQGLILGQVSILLLVYFILKYLFFDSKSAHLLEESPEGDAPIFRPSFSAEKFISTAFLQAKVKEQDEEPGGGPVESAEWLNVLLKQVSQTRAPSPPPRRRSWVDPTSLGLNIPRLWMNTDANCALPKGRWTERR